MASHVKWFGKNVEDEVFRRAERAVLHSVIAIEREVKRSMTEDPKTGRFYVKPGTKVLYQASAPGESPAVRTGHLRNSISHEVGLVGSDIIGRAGTNVSYAIELEYGNPSKRLAARPFLRAALHKLSGQIREFFTEAGADAVVSVSGPVGG